MNMLTSPTVAVLGLGAMGLPIAAKLAESFTVQGFDVSSERIELAADEGITSFNTAIEAVSGADVVLVAVRNGAQLNEVLFGPTGIVGALKDGCVLVLTSTVGRNAVRDVAESLAGLNVHFLDAPLSGGPARARGGDLLIVVGGTEEALSISRKVLDQLASTLRIVGDYPGDGQAFKTVNQLLCGIHIAAAAEALALARGLGLDVANTLELLNEGAASSFMLANRGPRMLATLDGGEPEVLSRLDIFVKDMGIVTDAAKANNVPTPLASLTEQMFRLGDVRGLGADDDSSVIKIVTPAGS